MLDKTGQKSSLKHNDLSSDGDFLTKIQRLLDNNIRIVKNVSWIVGGLGLVIIIRRTYALKHFTNQAKIPTTYFTNNVTLTGKVVEVNRDGILGIQHIPLLWQARLKWISEPSSTLLSVKLTGVELRTGGHKYLSALLTNNNVKFKLLGKDDCENIESILYKKKGWFRHICINEDIVLSGLAVASHSDTLSNVNAYNILIERLVKMETKAVRKKTGIWNEESESDDNMFRRLWYWLKSKVFKT